MKALVAGWFSFEDMGATAGDLLARDMACEWLNHAGYTYDVALALPFVAAFTGLQLTPGCTPCALRLRAIPLLLAPHGVFATLLGSASSRPQSLHA